MGNFKFLNKGISTPTGIIIIVLCAFIAGGIFAWQYWWSPKEEVKDETADWQTYKNDEYGFEIKYPRDWMSEQNVYSVKPNLVFCLLSLTEVYAGETICKLKAGASKPQYEDGMIYLFNYASDQKSNNSDYHYLGVDHLGYYYYLYSSASGNKSIINQMFSTVRFFEVTEQVEEVSEEEKYCEKDTDCACGVNINTKGCFYGNKDYVDTKQQCPDFCTGISGDFTIRCVNSECKQVRLSQ